MIDDEENDVPLCFGHPLDSKSCHICKYYSVCLKEAEQYG